MLITSSRDIKPYQLVKTGREIFRSWHVIVATRWSCVELALWLSFCTIHRYVSECEVAVDYIDRGKACSNATWFTANLTRIDQEANPGLSGEKPVNNRLNYRRVMADPELAEEDTFQHGNGWARVRSPTEAEDFFSAPCVQTGSGAHPASCTVGTGASFPGGKGRPGRDGDH
jgi:hypothetical protein